MSSRCAGLSAALQAPGRFDVRSVPATGDCFYEALDAQLSASERPEALRDAGAMRDTVADAMTQELYDLYAMYAAAGVEGYEFMSSTRRSIADLEALRAFARIRGRCCGAGQCLWADEFALRHVARLADACILIFDEQANGRGSRSGRRRGDDVARDGRFVRLDADGGGEGGGRRTLLLHRSRRQHYNPVFLDGRGVFERADLPAATRALFWPTEPDPEGGGASREDERAVDPDGAHRGKARRRAAEVATAVGT